MRSIVGREFHRGKSVKVEHLAFSVQEADCFGLYNYPNRASASNDGNTSISLDCSSMLFKHSIHELKSKYFMNHSFLLTVGDLKELFETATFESSW